MMTEARIGPNFTDWKAFVAQAFKIKFPGYGIGPGPRVPAAAGREFIVEVIEIPQASGAVLKDQYFVLEKISDKALRLVDDFVMASRYYEMKPRGSIRVIAFRVFTNILGRPLVQPAISSIRLVNDRLVYTDPDGSVVRETHVSLNQ